MKIFYWIFGILMVLLGGFYTLNSYIYNEKQGDGPVRSYKDATYSIDGKVIKLANGVSEMEAAPGSASKIITKYFGNEVFYDFDGDGREDVVFLLTQETGGSGIFYYVVGALNKEDGFMGSQALFLGDRIAPQTTELSKNLKHKNVVVVNYADRAPGEPFTKAPSVGKSMWLRLDTEDMQFGEVVQDFSGEADPSRMTLFMKTWIWIDALYNDERTLTPKTPGQFSITFSENGKFTATTDCNAMGGSFSAQDDSITFSNIYMTKKYCEGSQEGEFAKLLETTNAYHFTGKGELIFDLKFDSGSVMFR